MSEECAAACENFPNDKQLATCAKTWRAYAKGCAVMVQMMKLAHTGVRAFAAPGG